MGTWVASSETGSWYVLVCPDESPQSIFVPGGAGDAPPPPPPSPVEAAAATPFPAETIHFNPCLGLTGLTSWFWATSGAGTVSPVTAAATIRGYTVRVSAAPVSYRWDIESAGGATVTLSGSTPGSAAMPNGQITVVPSVSWQPQTKGWYTVTLTVTWSGSYTFSGYGITDTYPLAPVDQSPPEVRRMPVQQIVSVLVAPGYQTPTTSIPSNPLTC